MSKLNLNLELPKEPDNWYEVEYIVPSDRGGTVDSVMDVLADNTDQAEEIAYKSSATGTIVMGVYLRGSYADFEAHWEAKRKEGEYSMSDQVVLVYIPDVADAVCGLEGYEL